MLSFDVSETSNEVHVNRVNFFCDTGSKYILGNGKSEP